MSDTTENSPDRDSVYEQTLKQVIVWLEGDGVMDFDKPVSAANANRIARICRHVVFDNMTLKEAVDATEEP